MTAICKDCRYWAGRSEHWTPLRAVCSRVHSGGGQRPEEARLFPVTSGAYLETAAEFGCSMGEPVEAQEGTATEPMTLAARLRAASEPFAVSAREARPLFLEAAAEIEKLRARIGELNRDVEGLRKYGPAFGRADMTVAEKHREARRQEERDGIPSDDI